MNRFSFLESFHEALSGLSDEHYSLLVRAISEFVFNNVEPQLEGTDKVVWLLVKNDVMKGVQISKSRSLTGQVIFGDSEFFLKLINYGTGKSE